MKTLLTLLLLIPSLCWGEVFNCEMTLTSDTWGTQKYDVLVDTGNKEQSYLTVVDDDANLDAYDGGFHILMSIGDIYFQKGNPYAVGKYDDKVLFQNAFEDEYMGVILRVDQGPSTIVLKNTSRNKNSPNWIITITDSDTQFDEIQKGKCD